MTQTVSGPGLTMQSLRVSKYYFTTATGSGFEIQVHDGSAQLNRSQSPLVDENVDPFDVNPMRGLKHKVFTADELRKFAELLMKIAADMDAGEGLPLIYCGQSGGWQPNVNRAEVRS